MDNKNQEFHWTEGGRENILKVTKTQLIYTSVAYNYSKVLNFKDFSKFKYRAWFFTPDFSLKFYGKDPKKPVINAVFSTMDSQRVADFYDEYIKPCILAICPNINEKCFGNDKKLLYHRYFNH